MTVLKIFLGIIVVCGLLGMIGANHNENKRLAAVVAITALLILVVVIMKGDEKKKTVTEVAPESGSMEVQQDQWGTMTVTDESGVTREYQGLIHINGTYPYETSEFMGLCVSMEDALEVSEWSPGVYKLYHEDQEAYWKMVEEKAEIEKEKTENE